jgi:Uncharacterized protein, homolog of Cu resistance protein CopC
MIIALCAGRHDGSARASVPRWGCERGLYWWAAMVRGMRIRGFLLVVPVLLGVVLLSGSPAYAHVSLRSSDPADGAILRTPVSKVTLRFSEQLNPRLVKAAVTVDGAAARATSTVSGDTLTVSTPSRSGHYQVAYRVVSRDGHTVADKIEFTVRGGGAAPRQSGSATPEKSAASKQPAAVVDGPATTDGKGRTVTRSWVWLLVGLGGVVLLGGLAYVLILGRSRPSEGEASSVDTVDESDSRDG